MTRREAQEILLACRPGREDLADPQVAAALELARTDPALREWYERHCAWDAAVRQGLGSIPVPADLKYAILTGERIVPGPAHWWQRRGVLVAAAAVLVFLITLGVLFLNRGKSTNSFAQFRRSMIGTALREYRMDLQTNDMREIRTFLGRRGAPADYSVPAGLEKLKLTGCGVLDWQGKPVTMVCFERNDINLLWMFVMKVADWKDRPPSQAQFEKVITCATASWTEGDTVYVVASEVDEAALRKLL